MSFNYIAWAWQTPLAWKEKFVLLALADYADANGKCFPSVTSIATKIGLSAKNRNTVRRALDGLQEKGYLTVAAQYHGKGQQTSNVYTLSLGFLHEATATAGGPESTRGPESTPHDDERPVHSAGAVRTPGAEGTGVGPGSTTNLSSNPSSSSTTEEVTRTRENDDLDALEEQMVDESSGDSGSGPVDDGFDWFAHLGRQVS